MKKKLSILVLFSLFCLMQKVVNAQAVLPPDFADEVVTTGFTDLTALAIDSAGRIFVGQHEGTVWRINANGVKVTPALIDIRQEVGWWNAHGLMSMTLDKDFTTNGYIYLYYTVDRHYLLNFGTPQYNPNANSYNNATINRVTRYQLDPATGFTSLVPNSRQILIGTDKTNGIPMTYNNHDGGGLQMALDGSLILTTGDGGHGGALDLGSNPQTYFAQALIDSIITPELNVGAFRAQLVQAPNGKALRFNPMTGLGYPSNPYYDAANPGSAQSRVWSLGLRQPFTLTIRPGTGSTNATAGNPGVIYVDDVGFYNWEEINVVTGPGLDFGWPIYEGLLKHPNFSSQTVENKFAPNPLNGVSGCTIPNFRFRDLLVDDTQGTPSWPNPCNAAIQIPSSTLKFKHTRASFSYKHGDTITYVPEWNGSLPLAAQIGSPQTTVQGKGFKGSCISGAAWNTSNNWPSKYHDALFFCDYDLGFIRYAKYDQNQKLLSIDTFASGVGRPITLKWHPTQRCLYYIDYIAGELHRIRYTVNVNLNPIAVANQNKKYGPGPLTVNFNSTGSYDPEGTALSYFWTFGDGNTSTLANPSNTYTPLSSAPQKYNVSLTVTDSLGKTSTAALIVSVNNTPPVVNITSPIDGDYYSAQIAQSHNLTATVTDAEHTNNQLHYLWYSTLHHNDHDHPNPPDTDKVTYLLTEPEDCENSYWVEVRLTVTDDAGLSTTDTVNIYQACPPIADFEVANDTVCANSPIQFFDKSTLFPNQWKWIFTGANIATSTDRNPIVTFAKQGTYNATLIAMSPGGNDTIIKTAVINVMSRPNLSITATGPLQFCVGDSVKLDVKNNTTFNYDWRINTVSLSIPSNSSYMAKSSGSYTVNVTNKYGCSRETKPVVVVSGITASVKVKGSAVICPGDSIIMTASPINNAYTYQWTRNGVNILGATGSTYKAGSAGNYRVVITLNPNCINTSAPKVVIVSCKTGELSYENQMVYVFPNPSSSTFTIQPSEFIGVDYFVEVQDISGRTVIDQKKFSADENYSFGSELSEGVYIVKVKSNGKDETFRLIKTK